MRPRGSNAPRSRPIPIGAAFLGAIVTLWYVATQGAITIRFYDPASLAMLAFPIGFYIDRLSAVMMVLISGVGTIIYTYSIDYMYQDRHERRYLAMLGVATSCCSAWCPAQIS